MKCLKNGLRFTFNVIVGIFLLSALIGNANRLLFIHTGNPAIGELQKRFISDLPPGICESLEATDHLEYRIEEGHIEYLCSWRGGIASFWPFYEEYTSTKIPEIIPLHGDQQEASRQ